MKRIDFYLAIARMLVGIATSLLHFLSPLMDAGADKTYHAVVQNRGFLLFITGYCVIAISRKASQ